MELSLQDPLLPQTKDLEHGGLSLVVEANPKSGGATLQMRVSKWGLDRKNPGSMKEQSFFINRWELNSLSKILEMIVEDNKLNE